jgi:hypothetical protein
LTAEQLEASRAERMRQNGHGTVTLEDVRTWMEETGLCLFLPRRQFATSIAPSFVEAVAGQRNPVPDPKHTALAEELLVRLETDSVAVRLNLLGLPGEQPDFIVAAWVLPYVYALRGDRDWRRNPQLTGSRQVSPLAVQTYKLLEVGDSTIPVLKQALGREVTETAVLRAITELWQQLRIIPVVSAPGQAPKWQLLRTRFQKAIAEGASTSQVTAISVLASIYLQAVIAASMEEVEMFLAPLTARSKVREVLRGLVATRQVHTLSLGHSPLFYVAGTLPEFAAPPTTYASASMPASAYFLHSHEHEEEKPPTVYQHWKPSAIPEISHASVEAPVAVSAPESAASAVSKPKVDSAPRLTTERKPAAEGKPARPHFSRPDARPHSRKPVQTSSSSRPVRRAGSEVRSSSARPAGTRTAGSSRPSASSRWSSNTSKSASSKPHSGTYAGKASASGARSNGNSRPSRPVSGVSSGRSTKPASRSQHNGGKMTGKPGATAHGSRSGSVPRKDARPVARSAHSSSRKPAMAAGANAGNSKRYGLPAPAKQKTKKLG